MVYNLQVHIMHKTFVSVEECVLLPNSASASAFQLYFNLYEEMASS